MILLVAQKKVFPEEYQELFNNTTNTWTTINGVNGRLFTGNNGNTLFSPASGNCYDGGIYRVGSYGYYWSSSLGSSYPDNACYVYFDSVSCFADNNNCYYGLPVRGVIDYNLSSPKTDVLIKIILMLR